ncbi:MAG: SGNH/GDSL hydrolase family protein [Armatimonadetes bacterium]|nr:SGNH/GDSL hydrolase family protein [Armatimonadota bacterium]
MTVSVRRRPPWRATWTFGLAIVGAALSACAARAQDTAPAAPASMVIDHTCVDAADKVIPLDALDRARVTQTLLGHESVGWNVIGGLDQLSRQLPRYRLDIGHMIQAGWYAQHKGFGDFFVGNAANVPGKAQAFEQRLRSGVGDRVQVASLKLCWADMQPRVDTDQAFAAYTGVLERMKQAYPQVTFVYWTMPLRREAMLQERRLRFNELMAQYVRTHSVVLFDIADIECHKPDGSLAVNETGTPALWDGYTTDGGHLNDVGSQRAARAWWWLMARLGGWPGPQ